MATASLTLLSAALGVSIAQQERQVLPISQHGQQFRPNAVTLNRGDALNVVNDDDDLLHHAYISSDTYTFDSGDQEPGTSVLIPFPIAGTFMVLCGIHPKMKLKVTVR